jgi:hypothetical protein
VQLPGHAPLRFVKLLFPVLVFVLSASSALSSQSRAVSLCIVDTKLPQVRLYDPPAGPFATGMYLQLVGRRLRDGSKLNLSVFPASPESTILPEVHRLNCSRVLQLRYHQQRDDDVFGETYPRRTGFDSLLYTLWNGSTRAVIKSGSGVISVGDHLLTPYVSFGKQILKALNQER